MIDMKLRAPAEVSEPSAGRGLLYLDTDGKPRVRLSDGQESGRDDPVCRRFNITMPAASASLSINHLFTTGKLIAFNVACQGTASRYIMPNASAGDVYTAAATQTQITVTTSPTSGGNVAGKPAIITVWGYL